MSESATQRQKSSGTDATNYPQVLERETYDYVPQSWIDAGRDAMADDDELVFVATECLYERTLHRHSRTSTAADLAEHEEIVVCYRHPETGATRTRTFLASKRDEEILPKCFRSRSPKLFASSIAVPRSEVVDE